MDHLLLYCDVAMSLWNGIFTRVTTSGDAMDGGWFIGKLERHPRQLSISSYVEDGPNQLMVVYMDGEEWMEFWESWSKHGLAYIIFFS